MAMGEMTCPKCGYAWRVWRQYQAKLNEVLAAGVLCPQCGMANGEEHHEYANVVHFKGEGWTPKSGTINDLRDADNIPEAVRRELD